jgi:hypothetical protein
MAGQPDSLLCFKLLPRLQMYTCSSVLFPCLCLSWDTWNVRPSPQAFGVFPPNGSLASAWLHLRLQQTKNQALQVKMVHVVHTERKHSLDSLEPRPLWPSALAAVPLDSSGFINSEHSMLDVIRAAAPEENVPSTAASFKGEAEQWHRTQAGDRHQASAQCLSPTRLCSGRGGLVALQYPAFFIMGWEKAFVAADGVCRLILTPACSAGAQQGQAWGT